VVIHREGRRAYDDVADLRDIHAVRRQYDGGRGKAHQHVVHRAVGLAVLIIDEVIQRMLS
jgi:hypothetical protein